MTRLRQFRRALASPDALAAAGIASVTIGVALAWLPAGFVVLGVALLVVARYGTEAT